MLSPESLPSSQPPPVTSADAPPMGSPAPSSSPSLGGPDASSSPSPGRTTDLAALPVVEGEVLVAVEAELKRARIYAAASRSGATEKAYASDFDTFRAWCAPRGLSPLPAAPKTVAQYLGWMADAGRKVATIERALVSISQAHQLARADSPRGDSVVGKVLSGIRRTVGTAQTRKAALPVEALRAEGRDDLIGLRDRALLVVAFAGALRRSEVVSLELADLDFRAEGLVITLRRSKTDQDGAGHTVALPYGGNPNTCPVRCTRAWLDAAKIASGHVFRAVDRHGNVSAKPLSDRSVATITKDAAERAGLDRAAFSGHSLRAGLVTAAARAGKSERMTQPYPVLT